MPTELTLISGVKLPMSWVLLYPYVASYTDWCSPDYLCIDMPGYLFLIQEKYIFILHFAPDSMKKKIR